MPKFAVYVDGQKQDANTVYLRLVEIDPGCVTLMAVGEDGRCLLDPDSEAHGGALLTVTSDGRVALSPAVMPALGIDLDGLGRLKLDEFSEKMAAQHSRIGGVRPLLRTVEGG